MLHRHRPSFQPINFDIQSVGVESGRTAAEDEMTHTNPSVKADQLRKVILVKYLPGM